MLSSTGKFRRASSKRWLGWSLVAVLLLLVAGACRSRRPAPLSRPPAPPATTSSRLAWSDSCFARWTTLAFKGQFTYRDTRLDQKAQYRLHLERGRRVWISITVLGVEGLRALITPDSLWMINRLERAVYRARYDTLTHWLGYAPPLADFQRLLIGLLPSQVTCRDSNRYVRCQAGPQLLLDFLLRAGTAPCVEEVQLNQPARSLRLQHSDFRSQLPGLWLPYRSQLTAEGEQVFTLRLEHRNVEVNPPGLTFAFRIPDGYE